MLKDHEGSLRAIWYEEGYQLKGLLSRVVDLFEQATLQKEACVNRVKELGGPSAKPPATNDTSLWSPLQRAERDLEDATRFVDMATEDRSKVVSKLYANGVELLKMAIIDHTKRKSLGEQMRTMLTSLPPTKGKDASWGKAANGVLL